MSIKDIYPASIFKLIYMNDLAKEHFDYHPIWSEHYDYEERQEIISWGVDADWLNRELDEMIKGSDHPAYPILKPYPLPQRMRLFIRARIETAGGAQLNGMIMNQNGQCLSIWHNDQEFFFSTLPALKYLNPNAAIELRKSLGRDDDPIYPIWVETDFLGSDDQPIEGTYDE